MTGEAEDGNFVYETRPLAGAEYTITAAEDIYTQDRQTDNYGNRTLWYAKGDVVAVVTTGDGSADIAAFAPARTKATTLRKPSRLTAISAPLKAMMSPLHGITN